MECEEIEDVVTFPFALAAPVLAMMAVKVKQGRPTVIRVYSYISMTKMVSHQWIESCNIVDSL